jgi:hypothetical protein
MHGQVHTRVAARAVVGELTAVYAAKSPKTEFPGGGWGVVVLIEAEQARMSPRAGFGASQYEF